MRLAVCGASCVGKSAAARLVSREAGTELRSCGDAVRAAARALGLDPDVLPDEAHLSVDAETVEWTRRREPCLVEGRFLDQVLAHDRADGAVVLVAFTASEEVRTARARVRSGSTSFSIGDLRRLDAGDDEFRARLYGDRAVALPDHVLDTSDRTVAECATWIRRLVAAPP